MHADETLNAEWGAVEVRWKFDFLLQNLSRLRSISRQKRNTVFHSTLSLPLPLPPSLSSPFPSTVASLLAGGNSSPLCRGVVRGAGIDLCIFLGIDLPPLLNIFHGNRETLSRAALSPVYFASRPRKNAKHPRDRRQKNERHLCLSALRAPRPLPFPRSRVTKENVYGPGIRPVPQRGSDATALIFATRGRRFRQLLLRE